MKVRAGEGGFEPDPIWWALQHTDCTLPHVPNSPVIPGIIARYCPTVNRLSPWPVGQGLQGKCRLVEVANRFRASSVSIANR